HRSTASGEEEVPVADLRIGDRVRVRAGERVPADGVVRHGESAVDEASLTGEPMPVRKTPDSRVFAGSLNGEGTIEVEVRELGPATFLGQIGEMLVEAESARVPLRERADRLASIFVPFVLGVAAFAAAGWAILGRAPLPVVVLVFVSVVITACPCAFGLATPAAILVGTGTAAEEGILFRGGDGLERAATVDRVLVDKTGTLTEGRPTVTGFRTAEGESELACLGLAAGLETASTHPMATAIREFVRSRAVTPIPVEGLRVRPGIGVEGIAGGVPVGLTSIGEGPPPSEAIAELVGAADARGASIALLRKDGRPIAAFQFEDPVRREAAEAVRTLRDAGIACEILSGDSEAAVAAVARSVGASAYRAGLTPAEKLAIVRERQREGRVVAFVGDGVNDAPALAAADVGIAVGTGAEVARQAGRILLVRPDLRGVPRSLEFARRTVRKVRQNLAWAVGYNLLLLPVAAGALVPLFGFAIFGILPETGAIAMGLSSTIVLANSLSLRRGGTGGGTGSGSLARSSGTAG
ncbi:MAG TPA: heavy metal translocating P-type ATPase, partial [Thermoplasmata archaeon]|nr:heavy metal translocating P-type ATPase [Thermoplasmata archaeon]